MASVTHQALLMIGAAGTAATAPKGWAAPLSAVPPSALKSQSFRADASSYAGDWLRPVTQMFVAPPPLGWARAFVAPVRVMNTGMIDPSSYANAWLTWGGDADCPTAGAFLARTSGLDATHIAAYNALICGLATDGLSLPTTFDALYIFATQDSTTALLNLVSATYNATAIGSPSFTADRGFTGINGSSTTYIDTNFDWTTASSPLFDSGGSISAHMSAWSVTNPGTSTNAMIGMVSSLGNLNAIYPRYTDGNSYNRVFSQAVGGVATASPIGHYLTTRNSTTNLDAYKNASSILNEATLATVTPYADTHRNTYICGYNVAGTASGSPHQVAMASIGRALTPTEVTKFYNRLRTYMTAVGVP